MRCILLKILRYIKFIDFDLLVKKSKTYPLSSEIKAGDVVFVRDGNVQKWACLKCPGNCGEVISLSLSKNRTPKWTLTYDLFFRPTVKPSIHKINECGCHFWITKGRVVWCKDGRSKK